MPITSSSTTATCSARQEREELRQRILREVRSMLAYVSQARFSTEESKRLSACLTLLCRAQQALLPNGVRANISDVLFVKQSELDASQNYANQPVRRVTYYFDTSHDTSSCCHHRPNPSAPPSQSQTNISTPSN
jgi:hypothetical protein